ncbi:hypothetical protein CF651_17195 [Paenibacillus rigui]|uniref:Copper resistance protein CopC n=2 Tax=Paenibacillus rigui TaxID=554312 RepID=A0A229UPS4_9BACL|nr:hypothetical protein CF651_17195 [Paenibacillus rigui]
MRWLKLSLAVLLAVLCMITIPHQVSAHATLVESVPAANAELDQAPSQVVLTFNERLEDGAFYIRVLDTNKKPVTAAKAELNANHTALQLHLPSLAKGNYLVTYHVISADGHPIDGTYLFAVGQPISAAPVDTSGGANHLHSNGLSTGLSFEDAVQFISRVFYYMAMLAFTGWLLWQRLAPGRSAAVRTYLMGWAGQLQRIYLIVFIFFMFTHVYALIGDGGADALQAIFTSTGAGYIWIASLLLSLLGFVVLYRSLWIDILWAASIWLTKSLNGHASVFEPKAQTIVLDMLHLAAAALWVGGLVMLLVLWRKDREEGLAFFPRFSATALYSIVLLMVTGVLSVLIFLPNLTYIIETEWGQLLLAKSALVLLVVVTGMILRSIYRKRRLKQTALFLGTDAVLAVLIVGIVGIFTYLTPLPSNKPLNWHVMGEKIHMTAQITPNVPGVNDFTVKVWLPEKLGKPKQILMKLQDAKASEIAPLEVPLVWTEDKSGVPEDSYGGLSKYMYTARGAYLPYAGYWNVEIRVMDSNDDETVYNKQIRLF